MKNAYKVLLVIGFLCIIISFSNTTHPQMSGITDGVVADEPQALSVILMIGDGMGYEHVDLGRLVEKGEFGSLVMQQLDWNASATTYSANAAITDSAASATALATGYKTYNGMISVNPSGIPLETILEIAQSLNKSTGVVTTAFIQHATPAAFMTHVMSRNDYAEISRQIVEVNAPEVILGGGLTYFTPSQLTSLESQGYTIVQNRTDLLNINQDKVLGLFANDYMPYESGRDYTVTPSLAEMTNKSIEILSEDTDGFFLMIEGGRIDHAGHANNKTNDALETIEFDKAIEVACNYVSTHSNTILIVTADHETGGLVITDYNLSDELPSDLLSESENRLLRIERANNVSVTWSTVSHTDAHVPIFAVGGNFENQMLDVTLDNTDIFDIMNDHFSGAIRIILDSPDLLTPTWATFLSDDTPILSWSNVFGAKEYLLQLDIETSFTSIYIHNITETTTFHELVTPLSDGMWFWRVAPKDSIGTMGQLSEIWNFTVDTQNPTWDEMPADQVIELGISFYYDLNASDPFTIDHYWINDTTHFTIDENGIVQNSTILNQGSYFLEVRAYDLSNNYCFAVFNVTVIEYGTTTDTTTSSINGGIEIDPPLLVGISGIIVGIFAIIILSRWKQNIR